MRMRSGTTMAVSMALLAGCVGRIGDGSVDDGPSVDPTQQSLACDEGAGPSVSPMRRIGQGAYVNTLRDLTARLLSPAEADDILAVLEQSLVSLPHDNAHVKSEHQDYQRLDQGSSQAHVDAYYQAALAAAREMTATSARLVSLAGSCATDQASDNDAACVTAFVARLAPLALRRPASGDEIAFYSVDAAGSASDVSADAFAERVAILLQAPQFLYHIEDARPENEERASLFPLSAYEVASRLSYHFWNTMPDDQLFAAAESGALDTEAGYQAEVERLWADPRTAETLDEFFRAWLWLDELPQLDAAVGSAPFDDFAAADVPGPQLTHDISEEALDLVRYYTWTAPGDLNDLLLSDLSFAKTADLAAIYRVPIWKEGESPPTMPEGERAGLLTRAARLVSGGHETRPIMKGLWILERLLCNDLPPPPPDAELTELVEVPPDATQRERIELLTLQPGSECAGCHQLINPYGFATESYDALGRYRQMEKVYDEEGTLIASMPVNDTSEHGNGGVALSETIASTGDADACMAANYFRFAFGRLEDAKLDDCTVESLREALRTGSLADMFRTVALHPSFRERRRGE
jgi:hypothetical protein